MLNTMSSFSRRRVSTKWHLAREGSTNARKESTVRRLSSINGAAGFHSSRNRHVATCLPCGARTCVPCDDDTRITGVPSCCRSLYTVSSSSSSDFPQRRSQTKEFHGPLHLTLPPVHTSLISPFSVHRHTYVRRHSVFVSKHNSLNLTSSQIIEYCEHHGISREDVRITTSHVIVRECPFCPKPTKGKADNQFKLYVSIGGGAHFCHRCGAKGSWYDFKMKLGGFNIVDANGRATAGDGGRFELEGLQAAASEGGRQPRREMTVGESTRAGLKPTTSGLFVSQGWGSYAPQASSSTGTTSVAATGAAACKNSKCLPMPSERLAAAYISSLLDQPGTNNSLMYLTNERGINKQTLRKYGVGRGTYRFPSNKPNSTGRYVEAECVTFPWIMRASEIAEQESLRGETYVWDDTTGRQVEQESEGDREDGDEKERTATAGREEDESSRDKVLKEKGPWTTRRIKARALSNKEWQRLDPPGGGWGLFGWHTIPNDATEVVITEGEYDAMAVYQATGRPSVSLPNGCRSLPVGVLPLLEKFEKVYLWMDNDAPGQEGAEQFAKKIGVNRCFIVQPSSGDGPKDANDALRMGLDLNEIIDGASIVPHEFIMTFSELRSQVLHEIVHPEKYVGVPVPSLPKFTGIVKGFRRGELTVLSGPTGSGKTTFLGQISLDFAEQGINTLWGSFEIKNTRLVHKLMQQFSRDPLPMGKKEMESALNALADRFESLPLYFMKFHGGSDIDDVLDAMDYAAYVHDVEHIILDNMQFMISRNVRSSSAFDKFDMQDLAVEKFRKFATERNVHVTLVVHPRKEDEGSRLGMSSIYGSAKATQEADTVLILQHDGRRKFVEIKKNRFDGTLGICPIFFQRESGRYSEIDAANVKQHQTPSLVKSATGRTPSLGKAVASYSEEKEPDDGRWQEIERTT